MKIRSLAFVLASALAIPACGSSAADTAPAEPEPATPKPPEGEHAEEGKVVHLTPPQIAAAGIELAAVTVRSERAALEANGQIEAAADREARIGVRVPGRITKLAAKVGDRVTAGQVVAYVESPELGRAKADYVTAAASAKLARENAARERQLFDKQISSEVEWKTAEAEATRTAAERQAAENRLHALGIGDGSLPSGVGHFTSAVAVVSPIAGIVAARPVTLGQMVTPETTMFEVIDPREVWTMIDVFERDLPQVSVGQRVRLTVTAYPGAELAGTIEHVGATVEPKSRAVKVRVALANADGKLKPGMFARVSLADTRGNEHEHLFVPVSAVQRTPDGAIVFVPGDEPGEFAPRAIRTGHEAGGWVAIDAGLAAGDRVVTAGSFVLKSELGKESLGESGHSH